MEISSVREYLKIIEQLKENYTYQKQLAPNALLGNQTYTPHFIYRGHSNHKEYKLGSTEKAKSHNKNTGI